MDKIPDAPWIVEAETKGIPCADPPECPVCGRRCITIYMSRSNREVIGCDKCIREVDAWDYQENEGDI